MFHANTLRDCSIEWENIANQTVLSWIQEGVSIPFSRLPPQIQLTNHSLTKEQYDFIDTEIAKLLQAGVIRHL